MRRTIIIIPLSVYLYVYLHRTFFWPLGAPVLCAKACSITSGHLESKAGKLSEPDLCMLQPSLGLDIVTHDSDYPSPLPCQCSERSYAIR